LTVALLHAFRYSEIAFQIMSQSSVKTPTQLTVTPLVTEPWKIDNAIIYFNQAIWDTVSALIETDSVA
jgi:hypothetical protein